MKDFIEYLTDQFEAGKNDIARLEADGRKDDADFAKVRTNIYDVCRTVTKALTDRPGAGPEAVKAQLDGEYVHHMTFKMDATCFLMTITNVLKQKGVVEGGTGALAPHLEARKEEVKENQKAYGGKNPA